MLKRIIPLALSACCMFASAAAAPAWRAEPQERGRKVFEAHCASCHGDAGEGTPGGPPPLRDAPWVRGPESRLVKLLLHGLRGRMEVHGKTYDLEMPAFGRVLDDSEVADVLSFVRNRFGAGAEPVAPDRVRQVREAYRARTTYWTVEELLQEP